MHLGHAYGSTGASPHRWMDVLSLISRPPREYPLEVGSRWALFWGAKPNTGMSPFLHLLRLPCLLVVPFLMFAGLPRGAAQDVPATPEETGYFDGRFWRLGLTDAGRSALAVDDQGRLVVTGGWLGTDTENFAFLARWDGRVWETLATNQGSFGGAIEVMVAVETNLFVGGGLGRVQGLSIARFDGKEWHPLGDGLGTRPLSVVSLAAFDGSLFAGGQFTNAGTLSVTNIARWDLASETWHALGGGLSEPVRAIAAGPDGLVAGSGARVARWTGVDWQTIGEFGPDGIRGAGILGLLWKEGDLYATGVFGSVNGQAVTAVARWSAGQWSPVGPFALEGTGTGLASANGRLWVSGALQVPDLPSPNSAKVVSLTPEGWSLEIGASAQPVAHSMVSWNHQLFVLARPTLKATEWDNTPVLWHNDGSRWGVISGGLSPVTPTSLALHEGGAVVHGLPRNLSSVPLWHDGARFVTTRVATNNTGDRISLGTAVANAGPRVVAEGWWTGRPTERLVAHLVGDTWQPMTPPVPLTSLQRFAFGNGTLFVAGRTSLPEGAVCSWDGSQWRSLGGTFAPSTVPSDPPPTGTDPSRIYSLGWHGDRLLAGCAASRIDGQVRSNLVAWNGTSWEQFLELSGPATVLRSAGGVLYVGFYRNRKPILKAWDGITFEDLSQGLGLETLGGVDVSDSGLLAAAGTPGQNRGIPLWFRREGRWVEPRNWTSQILPTGFVDCRWMGNDLYLTGSRFQVSGLESLGLTLWHEPGPRVRVLSDQSAPPRLQVTGAVPARFAWEHSDRLTGWTPFATNALGNPGAITAPNPETDARFYRIRPLP